MLKTEMISLPIDASLTKVLAAFEKTNNVILTAPPGSGKTLRVPPLLAKNSQKKIIVLVPKRIAAISAASRIAEENNWQLGQEVGYQVRFDQRFTAQTKLIFMTEGVFVKRMNSAAFLNEIDTIVFDEFHERSSLNDIAFGYCYEQQLLSESKSPLKILVMSATLETEKIQKYLEKSITVQVDLKPYPLEIIKSKKAQRLLFDFTLVDQIIDVAKVAFRKQSKDILIFLPGLHEIRVLQNKMNQALPQLTTEVLHGSIHLEDQKRILSASSNRRAILSTNIAESSLTLPSVDCVIDSGLEKKAVYERKIGFQRLELKRISLFSAKQRAGRAARVGPGLCYQLWHDSDERSMSEQVEPEILKSSLLEETLILLSVGVSDPQQFSWLDQPTQPFAPLLQKFRNWNLVTEAGKITELGQEVQRCPLDLERSLLFVELSEMGFHVQAARFLAFLETADFSKVNMDDWPLNDLGRRIEKQLIQFSFTTTKPTDTFQNILVKIFLKFFPEKMAQRKEAQNGLSSLGRGVQFSPHLISKDSDYFLLLNGRDISDTTTLIDYAVSFSQKEFERLSQTEQRIETEYIVDYDKKMIYKQQKRLSGLFTLSTSTKMPLDSSKDKNAFKEVFASQITEMIHQHPQSKEYFKKLNFLQKRRKILGYAESDFSFLHSIPEKILEAQGSTLASLNEFFESDLHSLLLYLTPPEIKNDLQKLHSTFTFPSGKSVPIDYETELAPLISVRIQEALGLFKTPRLLDQRLLMTIELLAPNYRPAQITGDLENFWKNSYQDVRKDLRARYPKHDWPEQPLLWKQEMSKRIKK